MLARRDRLLPNHAAINSYKLRNTAALSNFLIRAARSGIAKPIHTLAEGTIVRRIALMTTLAIADANAA